jgi:hypothetical protein
VTLGLSLSAVDASGMAAKTSIAVKMSMAAEMGAAGHGDCPACDHDAGKTKAMACASSICAMSALAVLPPTTPIAFGGKATSSPGSYLLPHGTSSPPDPYPPRPSALG